jgi:hypothetical protein
MLLWALRGSDLRESSGQLLRVFGAAAFTAIGWVPAGNTGGSNISPFQPLPIEPELACAIANARRGTMP